MDIIQIVGYKNSGKTALANEFISYLRNKGFLVGSLKHHGHGGTPAGIYNKDSESHRRNGAVVSGVKGEGMLQNGYVCIVNSQKVLIESFWF